MRDLKLSFDEHQNPQKLLPFLYLAAMDGFVVPENGNRQEQYSEHFANDEEFF